MHEHTKNSLILDKTKQDMHLSLFGNIAVR